MRNLTLASIALWLSTSLFSAVWANEAQHAPSHSEGMAPNHALRLLMEGNQRFVEGKPRHENQDPARRKALLAGQKPNAIILSCSDSRVPPELIFDQGLGEVFIIRVAGNNLGNAAVASIEYAIEHLGSRLIVVMGHESCGAVKAALNTPRGKSAGSPDLDALIASIQPSFEGLDRSPAAQGAEDKFLRKPAMANVDAVTKRLVSRSTLVRKKVEAGEVLVVPALYTLESGKVEFWGAGAPAHP